MTLPDVSVVIPTAGRPSVLAAVASALDQTIEPLEVIVVVDSMDKSICSAIFELSDTVRVLFTGGIGANGARMRGAAEAKGEIVAFLDDDDAWTPDKLQRQISLWSEKLEGRSYALISCRIAVIDADGSVLRTLPSRLLSAQENVARYLFRRTSIAYGEGLLHTSTLICDRALVEMEPWDQDLSRHQDWDWVLRVGRRPDVVLRMCPDVLVRVALPDTRSISMSNDWRASLDWLEQRMDQLTARERGDFLLCHTAPIAIRSGNRRGAFIAADRALRLGRPGFTAWLVWGLHLLSPRLVDYTSSLISIFHRWLGYRRTSRSKLMRISGHYDDDLFCLDELTLLKSLPRKGVM
jgi:glycosyltransferase involved in cell wall biosynthesis